MDIVVSMRVKEGHVIEIKDTTVGKVDVLIERVKEAIEAFTQKPVELEGTKFEIKVVK